MDEQDLGEIEARAKAATDEDAVCDCEDRGPGLMSTWVRHDGDCRAVARERAMQEVDDHAAEWLLSLVAEVRRLREALNRLAGAVDAARHDLGTSYPAVSETLLLAFVALGKRPDPPNESKK